MSTRTDIKIFIASSGELEAERKESGSVIIELNKIHLHLHLEPMLFEFDTSSGNVQFKERIQDGINPKLNESHIVVILFYSKAGEFTLEELELALKLDKKVFIYFKEGFAPKNGEEIKKYSKVIELKDKLDAESVIRYQEYKTVKDYNGLLYKDLGKYLNETYPVPVNNASETISTSHQRIPLAPRPYLAHPYSIVKNFTGRREEMTRLTEWYKFEKEPMCIVEAIGGMGKSALCWKWLQDEIIGTDAKVEGVIWWSFYDQGFEDFIHHAYEYCIPGNIRNQPQRIDETTEVINALTNHRFLLVLDGFERVLRGYAQMMAMYIQEKGLSQKNIEEINQAFDVIQRTPITPKAEKLLRALCTGNSKTLMTSRLFPSTLEGLAGLKHIKLTGLSKTDTIAFFKTEGIAGSDEEMIRAGEVYGFHPLMLKLLSTAIKRSFTKDIKKAFSGNLLTKALIDQKEPQKILATSYNLLNTDEQKVASTISVFRTAFSFDAAKALLPKMKAERLEEIMMELCNLGFILYSEEQHIFDFHPILRSYLYDGLTGKDKVHQLAITYFTALPSNEKVITLADLEPVIEQYHHLIRAREFETAFWLLYKRLSEILYYQLAQYELCIGFCKQLFSASDDSRPQLSNDTNQSYILNLLGLCYSNKGQLDEANKIFSNKALINYKSGNIKNLSMGFTNLSDQVYIPSCKFLNGIISILKSGSLVKTLDPFLVALNHIALGAILTKQGYYNTSNKKFAADTFFNKALEYATKENEQSVSISASLGYAKWALAQANNSDKGCILQIEAMNWGLKAIGYTDQLRVNYDTNLFHFLHSYEVLGRTLIIAMKFKNPIHDITGRVFFYDEHFQNITDIVIPDISNYSILVERCVQEGLTISRRINNVFNECVFSLLCGQLEWQKIKDNEKVIGHFNEVEKWLNETHMLADRIGYRILLADLHLFCAEVLIEIKKLKPGYKEKLLNLSASEHLDKARDYAKDTSTLEDIFLPPDGTADEFYKDIPEYEMLKRGMTEEERIKKGYYVAWLRAKQLGKLLN